VTPSDPELILQCLASDDTAAFGELVRRHQSAVRGFLRQLTHGDAARSDDLAQETFIRAYRGLGGFRGQSLFGTWVLGIAYNQFRNNERGRRRNPLTDEVAENAAAAATGLQSDLRQDLACALEQLPADERTALHLNLHLALSHEEIASATGWPLGTVKTHISRGKARLRALLSAWNPSQ
jgi:RNA polymerase sigma-70 factor (ECF subfamily)